MRTPTHLLQLKIIFNQKSKKNIKFIPQQVFNQPLIYNDQFYLSHDTLSHVINNINMLFYARWLIKTKLIRSSEN